jgi:excisionase family DNA binding protein
VIPLAAKSIHPVVQRRYAKLKEAAAYIQVSERTVRQMIADGRLVGYRSGGRLVRVDLNEVDAAMQPFGGAV